ncbi:MAG: hypothetical protein AB7O61_06655 [Acidimicrobiia bacterium]
MLPRRLTIRSELVTVTEVLLPSVMVTGSFAAAAPVVVGAGAFAVVATTALDATPVLTLVDEPDEPDESDEPELLPHAAARAARAVTTIGVTDRNRVSDGMVMAR